MAEEVTGITEGRNDVLPAPLPVDELLQTSHEASCIPHVRQVSAEPMCHTECLKTQKIHDTVL